MEKFVFTGSKNMNDNTELIDMLDGRRAALGEEIELSESEVEMLKAGGAKLRKSSDSDADADESKAEAGEGEVSGAEDASASEESKGGLFGSR